RHLPTCRRRVHARSSAQSSYLALVGHSSSLPLAADAESRAAPFPTGYHSEVVNCRVEQHPAVLSDRESTTRFGWCGAWGRRGVCYRDGCRGLEAPAASIGV